MQYGRNGSRRPKRAWEFHGSAHEQMSIPLRPVRRKRSRVRIRPHSAHGGLQRSLALLSVFEPERHKSRPCTRSLGTCRKIGRSAIWRRGHNPGLRSPALSLRPSCDFAGSRGCSFPTPRRKVYKSPCPPPDPRDFRLQWHAQVGVGADRQMSTLCGAAMIYVAARCVPESGARAGQDEAKPKMVSRPHIAADSLVKAWCRVSRRPRSARSLNAPASVAPGNRQPPLAARAVWPDSAR